MITMQSLIPNYAYGYARTNNDDHFRHWSQKAQKAAIEKYIASRLMETEDGEPIHYGGCAFDADISGSVSLSERPAGRSLIRALRRGDHLVIVSLDRAFCSSKDSAVMVELFQARGIKLHIINIGIDGSTTTGQCQLHILCCIAKFKRASTIESQKRDLRYKRENGLPSAPLAPIGWDITGRKRNRRYVANEEQRAYAKRCAELHAELGESKGCQAAIKELGPWKGNRLEIPQFHALRIAYEKGFPLPGGMLDAGDPPVFRNPKVKLSSATDGSPATDRPPLPDSLPIADTDIGGPASSQ